MNNCYLDKVYVLRFKELDIFPDREIMELHKPACFKNKYKGTTVIIACEQQTYFQSSLRKITSAISGCITISVTSVFLHQSELGSSFGGANKRVLYLGISMCAKKTKRRKMRKVHRPRVYQSMRYFRLQGA